MLPPSNYHLILRGTLTTVQLGDECVRTCPSCFVVARVRWPMSGFSLRSAHAEWLKS
jgi:hypothetical protein